MGRAKTLQLGLWQGKGGGQEGKGKVGVGSLVKKRSSKSLLGKNQRPKLPVISITELE